MYIYTCLCLFITRQFTFNLQYCLSLANLKLKLYNIQIEYNITCERIKMRCLFVYNPNSGKSGLVKRINYIIDELKKIYDEVEYKATERKGHAREIARDACGKYDYLIVSGGDGTFNEIVNGVAEQENQPIIGYLPSGTVNDISRSLRIPRKLKKAFRILKENNVYTHDIFKSNHDYGIYFCGAGAFTSSSYDTTQKNKKFLGKIAYFFHGMKELFHVTDFDVKISQDGTTLAEDKYIMMIISNSRSTAGFILNSKADLSDGKVDVVLIKRKNSKFINYISSLLTIAKIFLFDIRSLKDGKKVTKLSLDDFTIHTSKRLIINVDGEKSSYGNMKFRTIKEGIKVIVPEKTIKSQEKIKNKSTK